MTNLRPGTRLIRHTNTPNVRLGVGSLVEFIRYDRHHSYMYIKTLTCRHYDTYYPEEVGKIKNVYILDFMPPRISKTKELP